MHILLTGSKRVREGDRNTCDVKHRKANEYEQENILDLDFLLGDVIHNELYDNFFESCPPFAHNELLQSVLNADCQIKATIEAKVRHFRNGPWLATNIKPQRIGKIRKISVTLQLRESFAKHPNILTLTIVVYDPSIRTRKYFELSDSVDSDLTGSKRLQSEITWDENKKFSFDFFIHTKSNDSNVRRTAPTIIQFMINTVEIFSICTVARSHHCESEDVQENQSNTSPFINESIFI